MDAAGAQGAKKEKPDNPLAQIKVKSPPKLYTPGEYLRREERSKERHEYFNGIIAPLPMAKVPHNEITAHVIAALK